MTDNENEREIQRGRERVKDRDVTDTKKCKEGEKER